MRKWYALSAAVLSVGLLAGAGQLLFSSTIQDAEKPEAPKIAANRITKVTVFQNSARVTREVEVPAGKGLVEVIVSPLPARIVNSSLYSEGANGMRVLSTRFRTRAVQEDTS